MMVPGAEMHVLPRGGYTGLRGLVRAVFLEGGSMCAHCVQVELKEGVVIRFA